MYAINGQTFAATRHAGEIESVNGTDYTVFGRYAKVNGSAHLIITDAGQVLYKDGKGRVRIETAKFIAARIDEGFTAPLGTTSGRGNAGSIATPFVAEMIAAVAEIDA